MLRTCINDILIACHALNGEIDDENKAKESEILSLVVRVGLFLWECFVATFTWLSFLFSLCFKSVCMLILSCLYSTLEGLESGE